MLHSVALLHIAQYAIATDHCWNQCTHRVRVHEKLYCDFSRSILDNARLVHYTEH